MRKSLFRPALMSLISLIFFILSALYCSGFNFISKNTSSTYSITTQPNVDQIKLQQLKAQIGFFKNVLDEFGADTREQVVELWVRAEETRNGVFHYAVSCDKLKKETIEKWGKPEENFWIIGGSSPWLDKYEVINEKKLNDSTYEIKIKYYWTTSAGPSEPTQDTLTIIKSNGKWCVESVTSSS